jgi:hypothetical protein
MMFDTSVIEDKLFEQFDKDERRSSIFSHQQELDLLHMRLGEELLGV